MIIKEFSDGSLRPCLYKEKTKKISNQIVMCAGGTGSGKSNTANFIAKELYEHNYTVIYITEKTGDELANAMCYFYPDQTWQNRLMTKQNIEEKTIPIKIYHPFTFNINKKHKRHETKFYTTPINKISDIGFYALLPTESENIIKTCQRIARSLQKDEGLYDFIWKLSEGLTDDSKERTSHSRFHIPLEKISSKSTLKNAELGFEPYLQHWFLHPENSNDNLDFVELANDNKHIHFLTTEDIKEDDVKKFAIIDFFINLIRAIDSKKVKKQVCLVFEELKILLPSENITDVEKSLLKVMRNVFSKIRTKGFVIGTSQSIFELNRNAIGLFNFWILGRELSKLDYKTLYKDYGFKIDELRRLGSLKTGEFVFWANIDDSDDNISDKFKVFVTPFKIHEQGDDFYQLAKLHYPKKMQSYENLYDKMVIMRKNMRDKATQRYKQHLKEDKLRKLQKQAKTTTDSDKFAKKYKKVKQEKKLIVIKQCYDLYMEYLNKSQKPNFSAIARKVKGVKSHHTAKKFIEEYKKQLSIGKNELK